MFHHPTVLLPAEYVHDAALAIRSAEHRVSFLCMLVTDDDSTKELIQELSEAAARGVVVDAAADTFTYGELAGHFLPVRYYTQKARSTKQMTKLFSQSKVNFNWLGRFSTTQFNGRTHIKWCVVDDTIYSFGGVNLYGKGISNTDYMFKLHDQDLAEDLVNEYHRLIRADKGHFAYRSRSIESKAGTVLIDGGLPGDSIIYRRACALARGAKDILLVSQYCPTGRLSRLLKKTRSHMYFNTTASEFLNRFVIQAGMALSGQRSLYTRPQYLHAKFMIFTMPDGHKVALSGSHNFVNGGVLLGTREIALETTDKSVIRQLEKFWKENIA